MPWIGCHGPRRRARSGSATPASIELAQGGDLTGVGVDEERRHRARTVATALPAAWRDALRAARPGPAPPRRGRGDARRSTAPTSRSSPAGRSRTTLAPAEIDYPWLRRYAAQLAERGLAPRTVARKLAGLRACFRVLVEHGLMEANPAELLASPKLPQRLPRALKPADVSALLDRIPASTPLELRDRALFELAYACGLRAEELVDLDVGSVDFDAEQVRVEGKGGKTRFVPVGEHALRGAGALSGARRAARSTRGTGRAGAVPLEDRPAALDVRRAAPPADLGAARRGAGRGAPARAAALVRDPSSRGRRRSAGHPGAARARLHIHDPGLHSGRVSAPARCVRAQPSAGVERQGSDAGNQRQSDRAQGPLAQVQGARRPTARASSSSSPTPRS